MTTVYIALGSNLADPVAQLQAAYSALATLPDSQLHACSSVYASAAVGPGQQPDYLNAVVKLATQLTPIALLDALQSIEQQQGRVRSERWGARTLDLDILLYGEQIIDSARLQVPHPAMAERNFVLYPLAQISGDKMILPSGTPVGTLLAACARNNLIKTAVQLDHNQPRESDLDAR